MPRILVSGAPNGCDNYINAILAAGGQPFASYLPPVDGSYDALLLTGGEDVDPRYYGQDNTASSGIDPDRDAVELSLARLYLELGKPILGICRGEQLLNVVLGGDLFQDIGADPCLFHTRGDLPQDKIHPVRAAPGSFLEALYGPVFQVNSSHHQAVHRLGDGLQPAAWSESGLVEAFQHKSLPVRAVQWHPERMCASLRRPDTVDGLPLFQWLIASAGG